MFLDEMERIFNDEASLQRWLDVEAALAKAEAAVGMIPKEAADEICAKAKVELINEEVRQQTLERTGEAVVALIYSLQAVCAGDAGGYIHWGATAPDITDTASVLAIKEAYWVIFRNLREIEDNLLKIAEREAGTVMVGRTHGQHAVPITFGFKVAVWIREIRRHIERLKGCRERLFVGQMSGAVGTFASFGDKGPEVRALTMKELGLEDPDICWHAARDRFAEFTCILAMIASTLGKIGSEIYALQRTEIGEVEEFLAPGTVGSSTMPHKRNPRQCENLFPLCKKAGYYALMNIEGMVIEHERGGTGWLIPRDSIPEMCLLMGDILNRAKLLIKGLTLHPQRMERNLGVLKGLILSEAVMMKLGQSIGRQMAHTVVYEASMKAYDEGISLKDALMQDSRLTKHLTEHDVEAILDPKKYIGLSIQVTENMIAMTRKERESD